MTGTVTVFCLDWHVTASSAFEELVVRPLAEHAVVSMRQWDRTAASLGDPRLLTRGAVVFCQAPPPPELTGLAGARVTWVPMWDELRTYTDEVWAAIPRTVRVVAYSRAVAERTAPRGFETLVLQYFLDPAGVEPATFSDGTVVYYWNRTGLFSRRFLARLCRSLKARTLLFRGRVDPRVSPEAELHPPRTLGGAEVRELPASLPREEYLRAVSSANVFLAPRACEGVGLMMLEALVRGQAVIACDAPAMNEYVTDGANGVLLRLAGSVEDADRRRKFLGRFGPRVAVRRPNADLAPASRQDWRGLAALDLEAIGRRARQRHEHGFEVWRSRVQELAGVVLDW
ncbi:MAG TPA: glycosyltransferase [Thermoanaerobaculaceae bacterium]|nr:glycosyltransferase [Thermoanaerobaculaceae bacterium]